FWQPILSQGRVSAEPLLIAVIYALVTLLALVVWSEEEVGWTLALGAGAIFAFGLVTKLSFLPMASIVLLFRGRKKLLAFLAGAVGGGLVVGLPIVTRIPATFRYFWRFFSHSGSYGRGAAGLPETATLRANFAAMFQEEPFLAVLFAAYAITLLYDLYWDRRKDTVPYRSMFRMVVLSGLGCMVLETALVVQHYGARYLLPAIVYTGFVNAVIAAYYGGRFRRWVRVPLAVCCLAAGLFGVVRTGVRCVDWAEGQQTERAGYAKLQAALKAMPECLQIGYFFSIAPMSALHFGNSLSGYQQGQVLAGLYPDSLTYLWEDWRVVSFSGEDETTRVVDLVAGGQCVLLVGP